MQQHQRVSVFRLAVMTLLLMAGIVSGKAATSQVLKAEQSNANNSIAEAITYDFAANPELINGLATGITGWNNANKNATITINNYTFTLYNCLRGSGYLSIRGDYNDKDAGADPGFVRGSMHGTMTSIDLQKRAGGGSLDVILEKSDGTLVTVSQTIANAAGKVTIEIPADKQVADAKSITIKPNFKLNVSRIVINRLVAPPSTETPWVVFKTLHSDPTEVKTFDTNTDTYEVAAGQIVQLASNNIEGFDPVSTMSNPYVVTYYVGDVNDATVPTFSAQTNLGHKYWRNGNDKDDNGNAIGGNGYVYRRGIVLSKEKNTSGGVAVSGQGESLKVTVKVFKITNVTGNTCTYEEVEGQTITKTFKFTSAPTRPKWDTYTKNIVFTPDTRMKTALLADADGIYTKPQAIAVLDPTENITVSQTEWQDDNTIVAKLSQNDEYDLQSLLNSASVSPTLRQKSMKSSSLKYRKISAMQYTLDGLASTTIAEACYWFIPERKTLMLKASSNAMVDGTISLDKTSENESERSSTITLHAYYMDGDKETTVNLKDLGLKKSDITFADKEVVAIDGDITFNENGDAVFTLAASNNGTTSVGIRTQQTSNVNANRTDDTVETAVNYKAASTQFSVQVTGSDQLMPPFIQPYSQQYSRTFNATVKGVSGVKTYYFFKNEGNVSTMAETGSEESTETPSGSDIQQQDVVDMAIELGNGATNEEFPYGGIIDGDGEVQIPVMGKANAVYTLYAVTANVDDKGSIIKETAKNSSRVISSTYTYTRLENPTLSPGIEGTTTAYPFSDESLSVEANVESINAKIYYTLGKDLEFSVGDDGNVITNATLYNSAEPITIDASTYVQVIAYNDSLRLTSDIVSYRYAKKSTDFDEPFFTIKNSTYTNGDKYTHDLSNESLTITARVYDEEGNTTDIGGNNVDWDNDKYHIYYTINGDAISETSQRYTGPFTVDNTNKNVTITAAVYADGTNGDKSMSDVSVLYVLDSGINYWETSDDNCTTDGVLKNLSTSINDASGNELVKVQFGSNMKQGEAPLTWKHYTSKEYATGNPIDNIGKYTIAPALDADEEVADVKDEMGNLWNHSRANDGSEDFQTHKATFGLPASGAYVKFEPKQSGTLTIWCCQEGALFYSNKSTDKESFNEGFLRKRPAYFVDDAGRSIKPAGVEAAGVLSYNWNKNANSDYWNEKGKEINGITQTLYTSNQTTLIYNMFNEVILANNAELNSPLQPLIVYLNTEENKTVAGFNVAEDPIDEATDGANTYVYKADENVDGTGVCLPSASYMKYTFDVKAGKTYFFFGWMTKIGIRGFGFEPTDDDATTADFTIFSGKDGTNNSNENNFTAMKGKTCAKVKVQRTFANDTWTTLVLPFSVSASQLEEKFGAGTQVLHYRTIDNKTMYFFKHFQQMIVAGTPVLVKPTMEVVNPEFENVTIESTTVSDKPCYDYVESGNTEYPMMGSYTSQEYYNGNYYISSKGLVKQLYREDNTPAVLPGTRAYIVGKASDGTTTQLARIARSTYDDPTLRDMNDETTDIDIIVESGDGDTHSSAMGKDKVYNLNGQLLNTSTNTTDGLAKGVYVVDGKKVVVK